jgi:uncharacterized delta-60 repeat protein
MAITLETCIFDFKIVSKSICQYIMFSKNLLASLAALCFFATNLSGQHLDPAYNIKVLGTSYHALAIDAENNLFIFGTFHHFNGQNYGRIVKVAPNGNRLPFESLYADDAVSKVKILPDGKIMISGNFTLINGAPVNRLLRLHPDGRIDESFKSALKEVNDFDIQNDGKIIIVSGRRFYRLLSNGNLDGSFNASTDLFTTIQFCLGSNNEIYFSMLQKVYKLAATGSQDPAFITGTVQNDVLMMKTQADGKILIVGNFTNYNNYVSRSIVRINPNGEVDPTFRANGANGGIYTVLERPNHHLVVAGNFNVYNATGSNLVELNSDGTFFRSIGYLTINNVSSMVESQGGKITIAGEFNSVMNSDRFGLARFNNDYSLDQSFTPLVTFNNHNYRSLQVQNDGSVLVGGSQGFFGMFNGVNPVLGRIANLHPDGSINTGFAPFFTPSNNMGVVSSHLVLSDNKVIVSGFFGNGWQVIRLNQDGSKDGAFLDGLPGIPPQTIVKHGEELLLGGYYTTYNGMPAPGLVAITTEGLFIRTYNALPANSSVSRIAFQSDGRIVLLGSFPFASGGMNLIRLNADGTLDATFNAIRFTGNFSDLAIDSSNNIYVVGLTLNIGTTKLSQLVKFDADGKLNPAFNPWRGFSEFAHILSIEILPDNKIAIGGLFNDISGYQSPGFAILDSNGNYIFTPQPVFGKQSVVTDIVFSNNQLFLSGILVKNDYREAYGIQKILLDGIVVPQTPSGLNVMHNDGMATISWTDNSDNEVAFILERSNSGPGGFIPVDTIPFNTSKIQIPLARNSKSIFRLRAFNFAGFSTYSNEASLSWYPLPDGNLTVSVTQSGDDATALVHWEGLIRYHDGYIIQRKIGNSDFVTIDTATVLAVSFADAIEPNKSLVYRVSPYNTNGSVSFESAVFRWSVTEVSESTPTDVTVFPVPTHRYVKINFSKRSAPKDYLLKASDGRSLAVPIETSDKEVVFDLGQLPVGVYFIQYYYANKVHNNRVLKY